jgi:hypothetical protein
MVRKFLFVVLFAVGASVVVPVAASAAMPANSQARGLDVTPVSFWARPYPDGYVGRRRCPLVRVETESGWYWERLCSEPREPILRSAY